jgi:hypothetical protein
MRIDNAHDIGEVVYLRTDPDQYPRLVTGLEVRPDGVLYLLSHAGAETKHYPLEITTERDVLMATGASHEDYDS